MPRSLRSFSRKQGFWSGFSFPAIRCYSPLALWPARVSLNLFLINVILIIAAILGVGTGYCLGRKAGPKSSTGRIRDSSRREHLIRTQEFYEKHGGKTIVYARFVPIIRTFAPFVAGVAGCPMPVRGLQRIRWNRLGDADDDLRLLSRQDSVHPETFREGCDSYRRGLGASDRVRILEEPASCKFCVNRQPPGGRPLLAASPIASNPARATGSRCNSTSSPLATPTP